MFPRLPLFAALVPALLLTSCLSGPNFSGVSASGLPATWIHAMPPATEEQDLADWWNSFGDPQLSRLIQLGFDNNPDMVNAALAIARAESNLRSRKADLFPTVSGSFGGSNSGSYSTSVSHGAWNGSLSASWTPDIWGGTRREVEAAWAALGSSVAAAQATRTALASSIATTYFEWISACESLRIAKEQLAYQERTYSIAQKRTAAGFSCELDLAESRATIASTRAQIPTYEANIETCRNTLATYLGTTVDQVQPQLPSARIYNLIPRVPTDLPGTLLRRRPDIIQAEYDLHEATADVGVNVANLFPRLSLSGSTSASSGSDFAQFFRTAGWSLTASVSQTLFNRVQLRENVLLARIAESTAAQTYRKTVLAAFAEVEECLIDYAQLTNQLPEYEAACQANKEAATLSLARYNAGQADFLNVASAERSWLASELNLIATRQQIRIALARLCTAMGGGWGKPEAARTQP